MTENKFGAASKRRLDECHPDLRRLMTAVLSRRDISIVCGHRSREDQDTAYRNGKSKVRWPDSKHNSVPSRAVDVVPWPEKWSSEQAFLDLNRIVLEEANRLGVNLRWGGDWDGDGDRSDQGFDDMPHYELK